MELSFNESSNTWEMKILPGSPSETEPPVDEYIPNIEVQSDESPRIKPHSLVLDDFQTLNCEENVLGYKRKSSVPTPCLSPTSSAKADLSFQKYTTTPATRSPSRKSLSITPSGSVNLAASSGVHLSNSGGKQFLQLGNTSSLFRLPKPQVKILKKTASVRQLYNSVLHAIKTIASSRDDIVPELTKNFFENILRESEVSPKLHVTKVKVKDGKEFGRHFCSEVHAVEVTAKIKENEEKKCKVYHLIVKSQSQNEDARKFLQPSRTFEKEVQMYAEVFHDMANYVRRESVVCLSCKDSEVMDIPRCFYTKWAGDDNVKEDLIILENLYPQGFMFAFNQDSGLDRRHAELVIRELAKFHAISFCMKEGDNNKMLQNYNYLVEDSLYRKDTIGFTKRTIMPVMASLAELIRNTPDYEDVYEWFVELARNFHAIQMEMVKPVNNFAVICHGDLWLSNILFRYESQSEHSSSSTASLRPAEVKFIDFQSARFSSLATDLLIFLFTSVETSLRREMLGELVSLYYTTFLVSVRSLNVTDDIFSLEELLVEIEDHILYGFLEGIWYLDIIHNGNVPKTTLITSKVPDTLSDDGNCTNEDEEELRQVQQMAKLETEQVESIEQGESTEQKSYKEDFFELLDEVLFLLGKSKTPETNTNTKRRSLRDTSLRFQGRNSFSGPSGNNSSIGSTPNSPLLRRPSS
ncbi:uncharacterized protein [Lepeophtheirus salmonis]|uniref:uncharacterized protein n=1 Tax=Lepeophtheirus salmonis TaxID=72036 RepID=UPI001AE52E65|nr:uncharacterized protein LOC121114511 [Lepeophtheirus salmonis]